LTAASALGAGVLISIVTPSPVRGRGQRTYMTGICRA
jgi:hypothetical protein